MRKPGLSYSQSHFAHIHLVVAQHYPPSHLAAALQVAERCARLVCRPRLNRNRRNFASPNESEKLLQILERAHIRALDGHHLEREQHGRDGTGSAVKPDHDELAAFSQDIDAKLHRLGGTDEVNRRRGPAVSRLHHLFPRVGCGVVDCRYGPHLPGLRALLHINVGANPFALNCGRGNVPRAAADAAAPMMTRWSATPKCLRVFLSAEYAVMPEQV